MQRNTDRFVDEAVAASAHVRPENEADGLAGIQNRLQHAEPMHDDATSRACDAEGLQDAGQRNVLIHAASVRRVLSRRVGAMPLELLGDIFEFCLPHMTAGIELGRLPSDILGRQKQPFILAAVCSQWRAATFACASVWGHVELPFDRVTEETVSAWTAYLETCSERSKRAPLTVRLCRIRDSRRCDDQLLAILGAHMPRCIAFHLDVHRILIDDLLLDILSIEAPILESVQLTMSVPTQWTGQPFPDSPLDELYIAHPGSMSIAPHNQSCNITLAHADLTPNSEDGARFLEEVLRLGNDLGLTLIYPIVRQGPIPPTRITCSSLEELSLLIMDEDTALERLAHNLNLPNLEDLTLDGCEVSGGSRRLTFLAGLGPLPKLTSLTLSAFQPEDVRRFATEMLGGLEALRLLVFDEIEVESGILATFCANLGAPQRVDSRWPCPNLLVLRFKRTCLFTYDCDQEVAIQLVEKRLAASIDGDLDQPPCALKVVIEGWKDAAFREIDHAIQDLYEVHRRSLTGPLRFLVL